MIHDERLIEWLRTCQRPHPWHALSRAEFVRQIEVEVEQGTVTVFVPKDA